MFLQNKDPIKVKTKQSTVNVLLRQTDEVKSLW